MLERRDGVHASSRIHSAEGKHSCRGLPHAERQDQAAVGGSGRTRKPARRRSAAGAPAVLNEHTRQHRHGGDAPRLVPPAERRGAGDRELEALIRAIVRDELAESAAAKETQLAAPTHGTGPALSARNAREPRPLNVLDSDVRGKAADGSPADSSEVMTADEVAAFLGVDRNTVYEYAGRGTIPHRRLGKRILFHRGALVAGWIHARPRRLGKASHACSTWERWSLALSRNCPHAGRNARAHQWMCSEAREHEGRRAGGVAPSHRAQPASRAFGDEQEGGTDVS